MGWGQWVGREDAEAATQNPRGGDGRQGRDVDLPMFQVPMKMVIDPKQHVAPSTALGIRVKTSGLKTCPVGQVPGWEMRGVMRSPRPLGRYGSP